MPAAKQRHLRVKIVCDNPPALNPREDYDNLGTIYHWHTRYDFGERVDNPIDGMLDQLSDEDQEAIEAWAEAYHEQHADLEKGMVYWESFDRARAEKVTESFQKDYVVLPVYMYEHGGIILSTGAFSCPWDSGQVGFIAAKKGAEGLTDEQLRKNLESEIKVYSDYISGNVWGFQIFEVHVCNLGHEHEEEVDSCWGFIGEDLADTGLVEAITEDRDLGITAEVVEKAWEDRGP